MNNSNYIFSRTKLGLDRRVWRAFFISLVFAVIILAFIIYFK